MTSVSLIGLEKQWRRNGGFTFQFERTTNIYSSKHGRSTQYTVLLQIFVCISVAQISLIGYFRVLKKKWLSLLERHLVYILTSNDTNGHWAENINWEMTTFHNFVFVRLIIAVLWFVKDGSGSETGQKNLRNLVFLAGVCFCNRVFTGVTWWRKHRGVCSLTPSSGENAAAHVFLRRPVLQREQTLRGRLICFIREDEETVTALLRFFTVILTPVRSTVASLTHVWTRKLKLKNNKEQILFFLSFISFC